jgi:Tfp pilus assembly protein PilE
MLQVLATIPFFFQKMVLRFFQPFFLGGLVLFWQKYIVNKPLYLALFCMVIATIVCYLVYRSYQAHVRHEHRRKIEAVIVQSEIAAPRPRENIMSGQQTKLPKTRDRSPAQRPETAVEDVVVQQPAFKKDKRQKLQKKQPVQEQLASSHIAPAKPQFAPPPSVSLSSEDRISYDEEVMSNPDTYYKVSPEHSQDDDSEDQSEEDDSALSESHNSSSMISFGSLSLSDEDEED